MAVFYGKSNLNFTQAGIKWNIKKINDPANLPATGKPGEVYILTDKNINKIKKVATIFEGDDLVDNAINLFYQESTDSKRINYYWGWYFDFKFNSQSILLNGKGLFTFVYFWDMNVNDWVAIQVSYNFGEKFNSLEFAGANINIENTYPDLINYELEMKDISILEPVVIPEINDSFGAINFAGITLDINTLYPNLCTFTESILSKQMNGTTVIKPITIQNVSNNLILTYVDSTYIIGDDSTTDGNALSSTNEVDIILPNYYKTDEDNLVVKIGQYSFKNCEIDSLTIPHTYTMIGDYAFADSSLNNIFINKSLINFIGNETGNTDYINFNNNTKLFVANISEEIVSIGDYAFDNTNIKVLRYHGTKSEWELISLGTNWSGNIASIICDDEQIRLANEGLFQKDYYYSINELISNNDLIIESNELSYFNSNLLGDLILPSGIITIKEDVFRKTKLYSVSLPNTITSIEKNAFKNTLTITINYDGTQSDWENILKDPNWNDGTVGKICCSDGDIIYNEFIEASDISGAQYNFRYNENTGYYVSQNKGVNSSYAITRFNFTIDNTSQKIQLIYNCYGQPSYDYGCYGNVDTALALSTTGDGNRCNNDGITYIVTFNNLAVGNHFIDAKYRKNASESYYNDTLQIKVIKKY